MLIPCSAINCTIAEPVFKDHPIGHTNMVSQERWTGSISLKCSTFWQEYLVFQDRWSLMAVVSQERFHCKSMNKEGGNCMCFLPGHSSPGGLSSTERRRREETAILVEDAVPECGSVLTESQPFPRRPYVCRQGPLYRPKQWEGTLHCGKGNEESLHCYSLSILQAHCANPKPVYTCFAVCWKANSI